MRRFIHRRHSIYLQMLGLLFLAAVVSGILFLTADSASEYVVDYYMEKSDYAGKRNSRLINELQSYIYSEEISSRDSARINQWVQKQKLLSVSIFKDGIQVFDSDYPDHEIWDDEIGFAQYEWMSFDTIVFKDGTADIRITGAYRYQIFTAIRIVEIGLSFLVFLAIVLLGIRKKMAYIMLLSKEVEILEAGSLDYQISVKGKDELSMLADGLDSMRRSFLDSREKEEQIVQENQRVITEMSHDLRTPLTSILLYTEILKKENNQNEMQKKLYVEKIRQKAMQVKQRTDQLLEYSLKKEERFRSEMITGSFSGAFFEPLSEAVGYLEHNGFEVNETVRWTEAQISYSSDYVVRIIDNIISNIVKYGDVKEPVIIETIQESGRIGLLFGNRIKITDVPVESTGVGIKSIDNMMKEMGGICVSSCQDMFFQIQIFFADQYNGCN